jgi:hypothetical protein
MSLVSAIFPSDPFRENWTLKGADGLVKQLFKASQFIRGLRVQMRFGELSRAPLRLVRFQMLDSVVECDWLARLPDPWDADLSRNVQQRHASLQTLRDAIDVRALLFNLMPQMETVYLRVYRKSSDYERELIIEGCAQRNDHAARDVHSLVMRAKILGFRFDIEGNALRSIPTAGATVQAGSWKSSKWGNDFS